MKTKIETLARLESSLRPYIIRVLSSKRAISLYSRKRLEFLDRLKQEKTIHRVPPLKIERELWGIIFQSPIFNAAGMFKNGECYELVANKSAGTYLAGTTTFKPREGNKKNKIHLPFVPYPNSHAASNWLGLPNEGDIVISRKIQDMRKRSGCPIGISVMGSPDLNGNESLEALVKGMSLYDEAGVDFIEVNESCSNTTNGRPQDNGLANRLNYIYEHFLDQMERRLPVIIKFSTDTEVEQLPYLLDTLFDLGFDGVNFGNTSTNYDERRNSIHPHEHKLYDYFTRTFGGGISGRPLKESSLTLAATAVEYLKKGKPSQEFHVIRTGGVETTEDIIESEKAGISLNQWFTGYFENFALHGHNLYRELYRGLVQS